MSTWLDHRGLHRLLLLCLCLLIFLGRQEDRGLPSLDDAYYARKAVEMVDADNKWLVTHNGQIRSDNPPLHFWVTAQCYRLFGVSDFTSVLASGLFATATVLLTYQLTLLLFCEAGLAFLAGAILMLPGFFQDYARRGMLDQTLVFFFLLAMFALWLADTRPRYYLLFGLATGAAILTKSVIGAFALPIALLYLLATGRWRRLLHPLFLLGGLIALALPAYWIWQNYQAMGDAFLRGHFGWLLWDRARSDTGVQGWGYLFGYLRMLQQNYWPWIPFLLMGMVGAVAAYRKERFRASALLLLWPLLIIGVMSLTKNQFLRYILAAFPALAILSALGLHAFLRCVRGQRWGLRILVGLALANALVVNCTPVEIPSSTGLRSHSIDERALAPLVRLNTPEGETVLNYRLGSWSPRNALLFYSGRWLDDPVHDPAELAAALAANPDRTLMTSPAAYRQLQARDPSALRSIMAAGDLVYATSVRRESAIRYDKQNLERTP